MTMSNASSLNVGDYVLATKYADGDPQDHWAIGFYAGITSPHYDPPRYDVLDGQGNNFRGNGFRRVEKISRARGYWMLEHKDELHFYAGSVWDYARIPMVHTDEQATVAESPVTTPPPSSEQATVHERRITSKK